MAMHLITGHSGTAHISAADDGALNSAIVGEGSYVFGFGDDFAATMTTANQVTIGTGALVHNGRKAWCSTSTQLTVESGTQAQRRNDLVVARYTKSGDVEDMQLAVIKGTPVSYGEPSDPSHEDGSVIDGATVSDFPLWRIPIDGITPGTPEALFDVTPSLAELRDSVSQAPRVYTGTEIVSFPEDSETVQVWSSSDVQRLFPGVGDFPYVGFSLGDNNFDSWAILGALQVRSGGGQQGISNGDAIFCQSSRATTGLVRLNYVVAGRQ